VARNAYQRIGLQNHGETSRAFDLTLLFDNDFADLFEVRGEKRPRRVPAPASCLVLSDVVLDYKGSTASRAARPLHFDPRPTRLAGECRDLSFRAGATTDQFAICRRILQQAGWP